MSTKKKTPPYATIPEDAWLNIKNGDAMRVYCLLTRHQFVKNHREDSRTGVQGPGHRKPYAGGIRKLADALDMTRPKCTKAVEYLRANGWVSTEQAGKSAMSIRVIRNSMHSVPGEPLPVSEPKKKAKNSAPAVDPDTGEIIRQGTRVCSGVRKDGTPCLQHVRSGERCRWHQADVSDPGHENEPVTPDDPGHENEPGGGYENDPYLVRNMTHTENDPGNETMPGVLVKPQVGIKSVEGGAEPRGGDNALHLVESAFPVEGEGCSAGIQEVEGESVSWEQSEHPAEPESKATPITHSPDDLVDLDKVATVADALAATDQPRDLLSVKTIGAIRRERGISTPDGRTLEPQTWPPPLPEQRNPDNDRQPIGAQ